MALVDGTVATSYGELCRGGAGWSNRLSDAGVGRGDRVAYLIPPGADHCAVLWGTWRAGAIAVPIALSHPPPEILHVLEDSDPAVVLVSAEAAHAAAVVDLCRERSVTAVVLENSPPSPRPFSPVPRPSPTQPALMIYTSGTTGRPKGVITTHGNVSAQIQALVEAWKWTEEDRILHVLPLHHVHGLINVLSCALWSGACCEFGRGVPERVWDRLGSGELSLFMAVPTIYGRLIRAWEEAPRSLQEKWSEGAARLRLMVSGSAALPVETLTRWRQITGHTLLERYGMTEIGMGLSNPLEGERRPGHVGQPLPGVEARIVGPDGRAVPAGTSGEIEIRGPQVFAEYWRRPEETRAAFRDGWFRTGDEGILDDGYYRILGRRSVDILKTGGYKVSALEIEEAYRHHPAVADLAVVGIADPDWGERVCAAWIPAGEGRPSPDALRAWGKERLAPYKIPREFLPVEALPRNAMGKVQKPAVAAMFESSLPDTETDEVRRGR
ncbi:MAG: acyl-CoA synthetase [Gemmatimonadota bacterium]|nr:acyl-CoA synthetase [Gemmatimonadota bacterium]